MKLAQNVWLEVILLWPIESQMAKFDIFEKIKNFIKKNLQKWPKIGVQMIIFKQYFEFFNAYLINIELKLFLDVLKYHSLPCFIGKSNFQDIMT